MSLTDNKTSKAAYVNSEITRPICIR